MNPYKPDAWKVIKFKYSRGPCYKVLCGWYGSYLGNESWRLSSDIVRVTEITDGYEFKSISGSIYSCKEQNHNMSGLLLNVYDGWEQLDSNICTVSIVDYDKLLEII